MLRPAPLCSAGLGAEASYSTSRNSARGAGSRRLWSREPDEAGAQPDSITFKKAVNRVN